MLIESIKSHLDDANRLEKNGKLVVRGVIHGHFVKQMNHLNWKVEALSTLQLNIRKMELHVSKLKKFEKIY